VVDASVAAKWWFPEAHHEAALAVRDPANELHAPELFDLEISSVVCKRVRRREISARDGERILTLLEQIPVRRHRDRPLLRPAIALAHSTRQSVYDCLYLALALVLDAKLVTGDARFHRAMRASSAASPVVWLEDLALRQRK